MSLKNPKIFGLDVNKYFADILDKDIALRNLDVNALDLSVIYNSNSDVERADWISFSSLNVPIWKTLDRYLGDAGQFEGLLDLRAGIDNLLFGDLNINGVLSGAAIRYRYLQGTGTNAYIKLADISTSRVSAWSSSDGRANSNLEETVGSVTFFPIQRLAKISYGSRIKINYHSDLDANGNSYQDPDGNTIRRGVLRFGAQDSSTSTNASGNLFTDTISGTEHNSQSNASGRATNATVRPNRRLQTTLTPTKVEFKSEIPTTKIKIHLDGQVHYLYAMKGIPLAFRGTFKSLDNIECTFESLSTQAGTIYPSWKVVKANNRNSFINYPDRSDGRIPSFRSSKNEERYIELYYPADKLLTIKATDANIEDLPVAKFKLLTEFLLYSNKIKNFPDFNDITPSLERLRIDNNPLDKSETISERILTQEITNKLPTTLKTLRIGNTFYGSIERNIFVDRFPVLTYLNLDSGTRRFSTDSNDRNLSNNSNCTIPNVPPTLKTFSARYNGFVSFDVTGDTTTVGGVEVPSPTPQYTFTGKYESGRNVIFECSAGTHKLAPGAVLSNSTGTGIPNDTKVTRIKGNVVYVDKNFTADQTSGVTISVAEQNHKNDREVYRDGNWVTSSNSNYSVSGRFSPKNVENLEYFDVQGNYSLNDSGFRLVSKELKEVNITHTQLPTPNLEDRRKLTTFLAKYKYNSDSFFQTVESGSTPYSNYKFNLCDSLTHINYYGSSGLTGPLPRFGDSPEVDYIDLRSTGIYGGDEGILKNSQSYVISANNFRGCTKLKNLYMDSKTLALGDNTTDPITNGIDPEAFADTSALVTLHIRTRGQVSGKIPSLTSLANLESLTLDGNRFGGGIPTFSSNTKIKTIHLENNELSGPIPALANLSSLTGLYLQQNRRGSSDGFTSLGEFTGLSNLDTLYCHYNSISGTIPSFAGCPKIRSIALYNNKFSGYEEGSIASLTRLKYFDVSFNQLIVSQIEKIIQDCLASYELNGNKRSGVTIDFRNNFANGQTTLANGDPAPQQHTLISDETAEIVQFLKLQARWNIPGYD